MTSKDVVWAKVKYHSFWPAIIVTEPPENIKKLGKQGLICVRFFGANHDYGWVEPNNINGYCANREKYRHKRRKGLAEAVVQCDEFLNANTETVKENGAINAINQPASESVTVRTELPFKIKKEPLDDDEFYQSNIVKVTNAAIQPKNEKTETAQGTVAEIFGAKSEPSTSSPSTNEPHKLEKQLQAMMVEVRTLLVEKKEAEKDAKDLRHKYNWLLEKSNNVNEGHGIHERPKTSGKTENTNLQGELDDLKSIYNLSLEELTSKSVRCDQLTSEKTKLERDLLDMKSKHESSLKELIDSNKLKIDEYDELSKKNTERIDQLLADKKKLEDAIKENASKHNALPKKRTDKTAKCDELTAEKTILQGEFDVLKSKHDLLSKELTDKSVRCDQLTSEKTKLEQELLDMKSKHESSLKELIDSNKLKIGGYDEYLKNSTARIDHLLADKTKLEDVIKENASKHDSLSKKLTDETAKCDKLTAEKRILQGQLDDLKSKHDLSSKELTDKSVQCDQLASEKTKLEQELLDMKSKHESSLKELIDSNKLKIGEDDELSKKSTERIDQLLADKTKLEDVIKENASKHDALLKKRIDKTGKCDELTAGKTIFDGITSESSSKAFPNNTFQCDQSLACLTKSKNAAEQALIQNPSQKKSSEKHKSKREDEKSPNKKSDKTIPTKSTTPVKLKRHSFAENKSIPKEMPKKRGKRDKQYEVESLLEHKTKGDVRYYLIRWKGYDASFNTWESEANLQCAELLAEYKNKHDVA